jgi:hypothetical protein
MKIIAVYADDMSSADAMKAAPTDQAAASAPAPVRGTVARATFTNGIENHEPVDKVTDVTKTGKICYFTELRDMEGQTVTHRWQHNGETMAEVAFDVGGPRWRVYSSKNLAPELTGEWKVSVVDASGNTLRADTFMYTEAPDTNAASAETPKDAMADATNPKVPASTSR